LAAEVGGGSPRCCVLPLRQCVRVRVGWGRVGWESACVLETRRGDALCAHTSTKLPSPQVVECFGSRTGLCAS
jgi:hypothetical protein